ncbi:MAG: C-GCAxxG-C-C family protein [Anaerolineae bacterium]|nr:C-GCAxxG-C-C family protein [Anaerolineae bacterium]MDW8071050.1 C-GCAxxG-C-C family protein [Anaerolineae bacterium]
MLAVGEHLLGEVDGRICQLACAFGGGVGLSRQEMCGVLSGGVMLIGLLYGRTHPGQDDRLCQQLAAQYRENFFRALGATRCTDLKALGYGSQGQWPCAVLVERAVSIFLHTLRDGIASLPEKG